MSTLSGAKLDKANLTLANLTQADLGTARVSSALCFKTTWADLSERNGIGC